MITWCLSGMGLLQTKFPTEKLLIWGTLVSSKMYILLHHVQNRPLIPPNVKLLKMQLSLSRVSSSSHQWLFCVSNVCNKTQWLTRSSKNIIKPYISSGKRMYLIITLVFISNIKHVKFTLTYCNYWAMMCQTLEIKRHERPYSFPAAKPLPNYK